MLTISHDESRVLGVLVEKALTTPGQYPLSLNAATLGCNQLSNRNPVVSLDEDRVSEVLDSLRQKGLAILVNTLNGRVMRYKHNTRETLGVDTGHIALLAELLIRGPQTLGELRTRANRMHEFSSLDEVRALLEAMMARAEPLVRQLPPQGGGRAERFAQLLCPDLHPLDEAPAAPSHGKAAGGAPAADPALTQRIERLEAQLERLTRIVEHLARSLGETDLLDL